MTLFWSEVRKEELFVDGKFSKRGVAVRSWAMVECVGGEKHSGEIIAILSTLMQKFVGCGHMCKTNIASKLYRYASQARQMQENSDWEISK